MSAYGSSWRWYLQRARSMTPTEFAYRIAARARAELRRPRAGSWPALETIVAPGLVPAGTELPTARYLAAHRAQMLTSPKHVGGDPVAIFATEHPTAADAIMADARRILSGHIRLFGREVEVGTIPDWHRDPFGGQSWPRRYWTHVGWRGRSRAVWELNRHQHLPVLALASRLTGDPTYAQVGYAHLSNWLQENPYLVGINWTNALEMALRLISWSWLLELANNSSAPTPELFGRILSAVHGQATFISENRSRHSSANNHSIGEAAGLLTVGVVFPSLRDASTWRSLGASILSEEIAKQIHRDGGGAEQTFHYLAFICDLALQSIVLLERAKVPYDPEIDERLAAAGRFLGSVADRGGHTPAVGDSDEAHVLPFDGMSAVQAATSRLAAKYREASAARTATSTDIDFGTLCLVGRGAYATLQQLRASTRTHSGRVMFRDSGYSVLTNGEGSDEQTLLFDHGPLGYLAQAAHGHADALSVWYSQGGTPMLVDAGTFTYHESRIWRDYFRGTSAHNSVTVDRRSQSIPVGPTSWGRKAHIVRVHSGCTSGMEWVSAVHDGYAHGPRPVLHRRTVLGPTSATKTFAIVDELLGTGLHHVELSWHIPPDASCCVDHDHARISVGRQTMTLQVQAPPELRLEAISGSEGPVPQGWHSTHFGERVAAGVVRAVGHAKLPCVLLTLFNAGCTLSDVGHLQYDTRGKLSVVHIVMTSCGQRVAIELIDGWPTCS
jgi:Heparinase II/III-like protein/Heparinase II/III N-terminus